MLVLTLLIVFHQALNDEIIGFSQLQSLINWKSTYVYGIHSVYPGSGFTIILPRNKTEALNILLSKRLRIHSK